MRDIKFRFWDSRTDDWCDSENWLPSHATVRFGVNETFSFAKKDGIIAQQYTGLKDKNGVEIYEGDRIIFDNSDIGGQRYEGIVEWNSDQSLDNLCWGLWIPNKGWLHCDFLGELEVIGNIFKVKLGKPFLTPKGPKKRSVYVKNDKGNVVKVNFGDPEGVDK